MGKKYFWRIHGGTNSNEWGRTNQPQKIIKWLEKSNDFEKFNFSQSVPCLIPI